MKSTILNDSLAQQVKQSLAEGMSLKEIAKVQGVSQAALKRLLKEENAAGTELNSSPEPLIFPEHTEAYAELLRRVQERGGLYNCLLASERLRDYYLSSICAHLESRNYKVLELTAESDLVELLNPLLEDIPLSVAIRKDAVSSSPNILFVRDPEAIDTNAWALLFALVRDIPALNLACVLGWLIGQEEMLQKFSAMSRDQKHDFSFGKISDENMQNILSRLTDSQLGEMSREDFHTLLTSISSD
jgi:predicted transcriptional regulator